MIVQGVFKNQKLHCQAGLKVSDHLVAHATKFLAVRLKELCVIAFMRLKSSSTVRLNCLSAFSHLTTFVYLCISSGMS